mgnify:CR=1 FL=1
MGIIYFIRCFLQYRFNSFTAGRDFRVGINDFSFFEGIFFGRFLEHEVGFCEGSK